MKKLILFAAILFAGVSVVKADGTVTAPTEKKSVTLTVELNPIQSIEVSGNPTIIYNSMAHYKGEGEKAATKSTINVFSTGGYAVRVYAADLVNSSGNANAIIAAKTIGVSATTTNGVAAKTGVTLGANQTSGTTLIESSAGGSNIQYEVEYEGEIDTASGAYDYLNKFNTGDSEKQVYTTTVYYTIAAN